MPGARIAGVLVFRHAGGDDLVERLGKVGIELPDGGGDHVDDLVGEVRDGVARERPLPRHQPVEDPAQGEDVAAAIHLAAEELLRRHERGGAHEAALGVRVGATAHFRDSEVRDLGPAVLADQDVRGLHVAMDDALRVGVVERLRGRDHDLQTALEGQPLAGDVLLEGLSFDELHDHGGPAQMVLDEVVDGHDGGMGELADRFHLAPEPPLVLLGRLVVAVGGQDALDRDHAVDLRIARLVDHTHAASAEFLEDFIASEDGGIGRGGALSRPLPVHGGSFRVHFPGLGAGSGTAPARAGGRRLLGPGGPPHHGRSVRGVVAEVEEVRKGRRSL